MARLKTYVVPLDFSKSSKLALDFAVRMVGESRGNLVFLHVIADPARGVPFFLRAQYYAELKREAEQSFSKLRLDQRLSKRRYRFVIIRGQNPGRLIAKQAERSRAAMIIMGSHGRTGLKRLVLGSVAERTVLPMGMTPNIAALPWAFRFVERYDKNALSPGKIALKKRNVKAIETKEESHGTERGLSGETGGSA